MVSILIPTTTSDNYQLYNKQKHKPNVQFVLAKKEIGPKTITNWVGCISKVL